MTSKKLGTGTSKVEVTNISIHGLWIYVKGKEYFLSYEDYPWFADAKINDVLNVELHNGFHLFWPKLDIDLELASLENPEKYPLVYE